MFWITVIVIVGAVIFLLALKYILPIDDEDEMEGGEPWK